jgi:dolichol kinase
MLHQFTGILALGLGDAAVSFFFSGVEILGLSPSNQASLVGRRFGAHRWSPTSSKTVEGSLGFVMSVFAATVMLRLLGYVEPFSVRGLDIFLKLLTETVELSIYDICVDWLFLGCWRHCLTKMII